MNKRHRIAVMLAAATTLSLAAADTASAKPVLFHGTHNEITINVNSIEQAQEAHEDASEEAQEAHEEAIEEAPEGGSWENIPEEDAVEEVQEVYEDAQENADDVAPFAIYSDWEY